MFGHGNGWGVLNVITTLVSGLFTFFVVLVAAGLIFLLVRFLLVATTAAKVYVAKNSPPASPAAVVAPAAPAPVAPVAPAAAAPTKSAPTKPASKPRTPPTPAA